MQSFAEPPQSPILVIGDIMLDRYVRGDAERISPEAPVPVVRVQREQAVLGGCGNVANNLIALGARVELFSVIGSDPAGSTLRSLLQDLGVTHSLLVDAERPTTTKTRVAAGGHQIVRFDVESTAPISPETEQQLMRALVPAIEHAAVVVISDYLKGVVSATLVAQIVELAKSRGLPVLCDPKGRDFSKYRGATLLTPNRREAQDAAGFVLDGEDAVERAARKLREVAELDSVLITLGSGGMALLEGEALVRIPTRAREVFDVSGAGDTVLAGLAFGLAQAQPLRLAAEFANAAAGVVVGKLGTATATLAEIRRLSPDTAGEEPAAAKVRSLPELREELSQLKKRGKRVVFTNGCFDILHAGHVRYLQQAATLGDVLVIGLNSDASVSRLKGPERPINAEPHRAAVLAALECVDFVTTFTEDTPYDLIREVVPNVLVKGGDYRAEDVVGGDVVRQNGGEVVIIDLVPGLSTTALSARMRKV